MSKILVTGASGNYGRGLTDRLIARGKASDLILISRSPEKLADRLSQGCEVRYGDFDKPDTLASAVEGASTMMLISGTRVGARVAQHKAAIDAASANGVQRIVYTSFTGIDDPANPAEIRHDHIETERLIRGSSCAWTFLRDAHYADAMIVMSGPAFMASREWISNAGDGKEAMVWRDDCIDCAAVVLSNSGHEDMIYNITGPELQSFREVTAILSQVTGISVAYRSVDDETQYAIFDSMGIPRRPVDDHSVNGIPWNSDDMVTFSQAIREGYFAIQSDDVLRLTGRPARSVRELIEQNVDILKAAASVG